MITSVRSSRVNDTEPPPLLVLLKLPDWIIRASDELLKLVDVALTIKYPAKIAFVLVFSISVNSSRFIFAAASARLVYCALP